MDVKKQVAVSVLGFSAVCLVIAAGFVYTNRVVSRKADQLTLSVNNLPQNLVNSARGAIGLGR
ncbi:MAG: hypothetical protein IVW51_11055 [Thermaceae bacterium]|nr:hypothetical protein [Thermaceae bacterium]